MSEPFQPAMGEDLRTARLRLRPFGSCHIDAYAAMLSDPEVMQFIGVGTITGDDAAADISKFNARLAIDGFGVLAVIRASDGAFLGRAGFYVWNHCDWTGGWTKRDAGAAAEIELGWALCRHAWGYGYATEAASTLLSYGFETLRLPRIVSLIHAQNSRSVRVAARLGAVHERDVETARWGRARLYVHRIPAATRGLAVYATSAQSP